MSKSFVMAALACLFMAAAPAARAGNVHVIKIDGIIDPAVANFVETSLEGAEADQAQALIIELDTPGGLLSATKDMVQAFLDSPVPVVVFVSPAGASATSAGMMITIAGNVAVMAPGTNIGASHPVMISQGGEYKSIPKDDIMMEKATNDTVGWVRSICDVRGRNAEWAEKAVTESKSIPAKEAVEKKVVDGMATDLDDLVHHFLDGRTVKLKNDREVTLDTKDAAIKMIEMSTRQRLHHFFNNPTFIYIMMLLGFLGIAIEFKNPGMIFPALIGIACLLFAFIVPSLPINYIGVVLILVAFALLVAEVFITSYGALTVAGVTALVFGSLMLFKAPEAPDMDPFLVPHITPPWPAIAGVVTFVVATILIFGGAVLRAHRQKVMTGPEELVGAEAVADTDIGPEGGKIFAHSEYWNAISDSPIAKGEKVVIKSLDRFTCRVESKTPSSGGGEGSA